MPGGDGCPPFGSTMASQMIVSARHCLPRGYSDIFLGIIEGCANWRVGGV